MARATWWGALAALGLLGASAACGPTPREAHDTPPGVTVAISPTGVELRPGGSQQFTAQVSGLSDVGVVWSVAEGDSGGSIDAAGRYTAPGATGAYHVVVTSRADATRSARATVTVTETPAPSISIDPTSVTLDPGASQRFVATVTATGDPAVAWSVAEGDAGGSVDADGTYVAPQVPGVFHVVATSRSDPGLHAAADVTVRAHPVVTVSIDPASADVSAGGTARFTASVSGTPDARVSWSVREGAAGGTIDAAGAYVAPHSPGTFHVVATAVAFPTTTAEATVTVHATAPTVAIVPETATVQAAGTIDFSAVVDGAQDDAAVTWSVLEGAPGGSVDDRGVYTAPGAAGTFHVVATSRVAPDVSARATVTVTAPPQSPSPRNLVDHGGPVLADARVYAVWWGDRATFGDAIGVVETFFRTLPGTPWLATLDQYMRGARAGVTFEGHLYDPSPAQPKGHYDVETMLCRALDAAGLAPDPTALYFVYWIQSYSTYWGTPGYHTTSYCHGVIVPTAVVVSDGSATFACHDGLSPTASWIVGISSHELAESMTDPLLSAWYSKSTGTFEEVADKCLVQCASFGSATFPTWELWSNADVGCVAR
jgi:hypothetical protein